MDMDDLDYFDDLYDEEPENQFDYSVLFGYVVLHKTFQMELSEFFVIENGFREIWNSSSGELVGDGEFKNYVYRHIEKELENKTISEVIPQEIVDECVDLILEYFSSIGLYNSDFSES